MYQAPSVYKQLFLSDIIVPINNDKQVDVRLKGLRAPISFGPVDVSGVFSQEQPASSMGSWVRVHRRMNTDL